MATILLTRGKCCRMHLVDMFPSPQPTSITNSPDRSPHRRDDRNVLVSSLVDSHHDILQDETTRFQPSVFHENSSSGGHENSSSGGHENSSSGGHENSSSGGHENSSSGGGS
ncbi:hypothetical protein AVEN_7725-1 [Araneus ventricosus]|uniref:Uncharacterized protein n=1 Tax=Araneus ventricosus TaxID=182803 RepID=A0A4Y2TJ48_ARAVE|nr:hypothetical protein AVEN_7725-1 [Araneus ventricosus]